MMEVWIHFRIKKARIKTGKSRSRSKIFQKSWGTAYRSFISSQAPIWPTRVLLGRSDTSHFPPLLTQCSTAVFFRYLFVGAPSWIKLQEADSCPSLTSTGGSEYSAALSSRTRKKRFQHFSEICLSNSFNVHKVKPRFRTFSKIHIFVVVTISSQFDVTILKKKRGAILLTQRECACDFYGLTGKQPKIKATLGYAVSIARTKSKKARERILERQLEIYGFLPSGPPHHTHTPGKKMKNRNTSLRSAAEDSSSTFLK